MGDAEAFLRSHPGQVEMLTIDIGANDVDGCIGSSGINTSCLQTGLSQITTDLPLILSGLRAADPTLAIYGMDYYDPFLSEWLTGASGQTLAQESETGAVALNNELGQIYSANKAAMADPATLFQTANFALTGSYNGTTVPENVALICAWTLMCSQNNIHANDEGHAELALAFESVIDQPPTTSVLIPSSGGATLSGTALLDAAASEVGFVAKVQFALTGGSLDQTVVGTAVPTLYGYLFELNTTTVPNGSYTLQSIASDSAGNTGFSPGVQVTIDNPPPTTSVLIPSSSGVALSGTALLDATAADVGGVAKVQFALTGGITGPDGGRDSGADPLRLSVRTEHHHGAQRVLHPAERRLGLGRQHRLQPGRPGHDRQLNRFRHLPAAGRDVSPRNAVRCAAARSTAG